MHTGNCNWLVLHGLTAGHTRLGDWYCVSVHLIPHTRNDAVILLSLLSDKEPSLVCPKGMSPYSDAVLGEYSTSHGLR